ncbi:MAG: hypothetical protein MK010_00860, partial [Erythrobacter sp.]|nr:hypothetical protein [Erythrobacter sp.]
MKAQILATTAAAALLAGCNTTMTDNAMASTADAAMARADIPKGTGYFASDSTLPFLAPDFSAISEDDYIPAF